MNSIKHDMKNVTSSLNSSVQTLNILLPLNFIQKGIHCDTGSTSGCGGVLKNFKRLSSLVIPVSPAS